MLLVVVMLVGVATTCLAQEEFLNKYAYTKAMTSCLGEEVYYTILGALYAAKDYCNGEQVDRNILKQPMTTYFNTGQNNQGNQNTYYQYPYQNRYWYRPQSQYPQLHYQYPQQQYYYPQQQHQYLQQKSPSLQEYQENFPDRRIIYSFQQRQRRQASGIVYDNDDIRAAVDKVTSALSNFTCVLQALQMVDHQYNLKLDTVIGNINAANIDDQLKNDLIDGVRFCWDFSVCLPVERMKTPLPGKLVRLMAFWKCERKSRLTSCFTHDLRSDLPHVDLSALPYTTGSSSNTLEKLMAFLILSESTEELEVY